MLYRKRGQADAASTIWSSPKRGPRKAVGAHRRWGPRTGPAERGVRGEEKQGSGLRFCRKAEAQSSGLCFDDMELAKTGPPQSRPPALWGEETQRSGRAFAARRKRVSAARVDEFTYSSQKVLKPSNIFLGRAGMIILSGEKPDNLLPLSFLKNEALRREPGGFHFA